MRHAVHDVIDAHAEGQRCERFRILRVICPFPRIAQVHVVADRDDDAPFGVADGAPFRHVAILLIGAARRDVLLAWYLKTLADVVQDVEDLVVVAEIGDRILRLRQHSPHASEEALPIGGAVKVVHHQETAS